MNHLAILASAGLLVLGSTGIAQAQASGRPGSPFPYAAPNKAPTITGVPCRTVSTRKGNRRVPVAFAGQGSTHRVISHATHSTGPVTTGSVHGSRRSGNPFPY